MRAEGLIYTSLRPLSAHASILPGKPKKDLPISVHPLLYTDFMFNTPDVAVLHISSTLCLPYAMLCAHAHGKPL